MDSSQLIKLALAVVVVVVLYRMLKKRGGPTTPRVSNYVPFDEMPFDTVPPRAPGTSVAPINVATDLLPKPATQQVMDFGEFAPNALQGQNFLEVAQQLGVDTQGSSMRNANYQLRADPPNSRTQVGPWMQSTIEADLLRRPLE
jgi:hypothetical protein